MVEFGHLRRAQARSAESESEENFAIFEAQVVDFEHSSGEPPGRRPLAFFLNSKIAKASLVFLTPFFLIAAPAL